jgi:protein phosphatase
LDKIAVISDVHGNIVALEAVLADIRQRGIDLIYNLGDLVGKGPRSDIAVDQCREVCQIIVRGNWDDALLQPDDSALAGWYREQLGAERLEYLGMLPNVCDFWLSGKRVRLYHASQEGVYTRVHPWQPQSVHKAMFNNTMFTGFDSPEPDIVGYGDIHGAYMLPVDDYKILFNAGSVGNPLDLPLATYVILTGHLNSQKSELFSIDFVRLPYDIEQAVEQARQVNVPEFEAYSVELRTAVYRRRQKSN